MNFNSMPLAVCVALGGLGIFLVSIKLLSNSLKRMTGSRLKRILKSFSNNPWLGLIFGIMFTTLIQSSDGAVALSMGLLAAGFMDLRGAIAFLLGANIGTASTSIIVAMSTDFKFTQYFMILALAGGLGYLLIKEEKRSQIAMLIFAFGAIFVGLKIMGYAMKSISHTPFFKEIIVAVSKNSWVALFASIGLTGLFQSSSATVTVYQNLYQADGALHLSTAIALVMGANIGTTFTGLVVSLTSRNRDAKRIAIIWGITNFSIALLLMPFLNYYTDLINIIYPSGLSAHKTFSMAIAHVGFNLILVLIYIWLVKQLAWLSLKIIPEKKRDYDYEINLSKDLLNSSPALALSSAQKNIATLGKMSYDAIKTVYKYVQNKNQKEVEKFKDLNELIDQVRTNLYRYLIEIGSKEITDKESSKHMSLILASRSLDKISNLGHQVIKEINKVYKKGKFEMTDEAYEELLELIKMNMVLIKKTTKQIEEYSSARTKEINVLSHNFYVLANSFQKNHIKRLKKGIVKNYDIDFNLLIKTLERIEHHSSRVNSYLKQGTKVKKIKPLSKDLLFEINEEY